MDPVRILSRVCNIQDVNDLKTCVELLENKNKRLLEAINSRFNGNHIDISKLMDQLDNLQNQSRRNNIVIHGVPKGSQKDQSCKDFVAHFLASHMKLE